MSREARLKTLYCAIKIREISSCYIRTEFGIFNLVLRVLFIVFSAPVGTQSIRLNFPLNRISDRVASSTISAPVWHLRWAILPSDTLYKSQTQSQRALTSLWTLIAQNQQDIIRHASETYMPGSAYMFSARIPLFGTRCQLPRAQVSKRFDAFSFSSLITFTKRRILFKNSKRK